MDQIIGNSLKNNNNLVSYKKIIKNTPCSILNSERPNNSLNTLIQNFEYKVFNINEKNEKIMKISSISAYVARVKTNVMLDTGALTVNCISDKFFNKNKIHFEKYSESVHIPPDMTLVGPGNDKLDFKAKRKFIISIGGKEFKEDFYIVSGLPFPVLVGGKTLQAQGIDIINSKSVVTLIDSKNKRRFLPFNVLPISVMNDGQSLNKPEHTSVDNKPVEKKKEEKLRNLVLKQNIDSLPPGCEQIVAVHLENMNSADTLQTMKSQLYLPICIQKQVFAAHCINTIVDGNTEIAIANLSNNFISLGKGEIVGCCIVNPPKEKFELKTIHSFDNKMNQRIIGMIVSNALKTNLKEKSELINKSYIKEKLLEFNLPIDITIDDTCGNTRKELHQLLETLKPFKDLFAENPDEVNQIDKNIVEHKIDTGDSPPLAQGPRRTSPDQAKIIQEKISSMLKAGIISPSRSPWSSPVLLVPKPNKPDGTKDWRFCIDFRRLNKVTKNEIYSLPRIDDCIDSLAGKSYFSTLDAASGYWQVPMAEEDKAKTAFTTYFGQYQFNRMAFGLITAPATYQRMMDTVLAGLKWQCLAVYLDDVLIHSRTFDEHLKDIAATLSRFKEANIQMKSSKCNFLSQEIKYLGHLVGKNGIKANPEKIQKIKDWLLPKTAAEVQSFLGLAGYYRKLVDNFASYESPLRMAISNKPFKMDEKAINAFNKLKHALMSDPIVKLPDFSGNAQFELHTDASDLGISAILCQIDKNGLESVIHYASRMLTKQELKYHTQEKEALAIVFGCNKFRNYLIGSPFIIRTDHHSLQWLWRHEKGRLARWALSLSEFDYVIKHRKGTENVNADVLSRWNVNEVLTKEFDPFPHFAEPIVISSKDKNNIKMIATVVENFKTLDLLNIISTSQLQTTKIKESIEMLNTNDNDNNNLTNILPQEIIQASKGYKFLIIDELLCRTKEGNSLPPQIIIPPNDKALQQQLLSLHHDLPEMGHFSYKKMFPKILKSYFWPTINKDTLEYCKSCLECQVHKKSTPNPQNRPLKPFLPDHPNQRVSIDLMGPFPVTENGFEYILCMVDNFTKWATAIPLKNKKGGEVAYEIIKNWYMIFGIPEEIHSDQGGEFTNDILARLNERLNVGHKVTTPYYPQSNSQVERWNRTLKESIKIYCEKKVSSWDKYIFSTCYAYNTSLNATTGFSPYYLMFGNDPRLPTEVLNSKNYNEIKFDQNQYQIQLTNHLRTAYNIVRKNIKEDAEKRKIRWDKNIKGHKIFVPGDDVLMFQPKINNIKGEEELSHKFKRNWKGPYRVLSKKHEDNQDVYIIKDMETKREFTVNVHKLIPFIKRKFLTNLESTTLGVATEEVVDTLDADVPVGEVLTHGALDFPVELERSPSDADSPIEQLPIQPSKSLGSKTSKQELIKSFKRNQIENQLENIDVEYTSDALEEYEIEKIINHKKRGRGFTYLIKFLGYDKPEWQSSHQIDTTECLQEYWSTIPKSISRPRQFLKYFKK